MRLEKLRRYQLVTLLGASLVSVLLYALGAVFNYGASLYFLIWNLFLAWLPLGFAYLLTRYLAGHLWSSWRGLGLTFLWLIFLPNCFYLLSDFIHIFDNVNADFTYNIALLASFAFNGLLLGYISLSLVHNQLINRGHGHRFGWFLIGLVVLLASYAVYLGRYIRLNSWDVFTHLNSVLVTISDQFAHPSNYPATFGVIFSFFVLIMMIYVVITRLSSDIISTNETRSGNGHQKLRKKIVRPGRRS